MRRIFKSAARYLINVGVLLLICSPIYAREYTIKKGDSLWKIAKREYGDGEKWRPIYAANRRLIGAKPGLIKSGQKLTIPAIIAKADNQRGKTRRDRDTTTTRGGSVSFKIPKGYKRRKTVTARVTAYEPSKRCCGRFADGITSTGSNAWKQDGCAVDPRAIPYGSLIHIPGIGIRKADDTGPALRKSWNRGRYHVDVRMKYFYEARNWGSKNLKITILAKSGYNKEGDN